MGIVKLFFGINNNIKLKLGSKDTKLYLGNNQIYPRELYDAVVTCNSATYNGSLQTAQNIVVKISGETLIENKNYVVTQNNGGTNAGSYPVVVSGINYFASTASTTFVINKANSSLSFTVTNITIGAGETMTNAVTVNAGDGTVTYRSNNTTAVRVDNSGVISGAGVGNATITANIGSTNNYNSASASYTASCAIIVTAKYNVTSTTSAVRIEYTGTSFSSIEVDGVSITPRTGYTFSTTGEHTVKYILKNTTIGDNSFRNCSAMTSVIIPNVITSIGNHAFRSCTSLSSITIPDSVTSIGQYAFRDCTGLTSVTIPDSVTSIGTYAFYSATSLTSITVNATTPPTLGSSAFNNTNNCPIYVNCMVVDTYKSASGWSGLASRIQGMGTCPIMVTTTYNVTTTSSPTIIASATSSFIGVTIDNVLQPSVTTGYTFSTTGTHTVKYFLNGSSINTSAFTSCVNITTIDVPSGITSIGQYAFADCNGLTKITMYDTTPPTLSNINAFNNTNNCPIYISTCEAVDLYRSANNWSTYASRIQGVPGVCPVVAKFNVTSTTNSTKVANTTSGFSKMEIDGVQTTVSTAYTFDTLGEHTVKYTLKYPTSIGNDFYDCSAMTSVEVPDSVTTIGGYSFAYCSGLTTCTMGSGVTSIGDNAFRECSGLTSITMPNSVTSIGEYAFYRCTELKRFNSNVDGVFNIPNGVTSINACTFYQCARATSINIPSGVTSIGNQAFYNCARATSINISSGVTSIGDSAFQYCFSLTSINIPDTVTSIGNNAFVRCSGMTSCTIGSGVTSIGGYAFQNCTSLSSITIPNSVTSIGGYAFSNCSGLTSINIPNGSIGNSICSGCTSLTSCTIGSGVTSIGDYVFANCTALRNIDIASGSMGTGACSGCTSLTSCTIGSGVTSIGEFSFDSCSSITRVSISNGVTSIGGAAFRDCSGLTSIDIPNSVTTIGANAFGRCSSLTSIVIPDSVTSLGTRAFNMCTNVTTITIGSGVTGIEAFTFGSYTSLRSITCTSMTAATIQGDAFYNVRYGGTLYVPIGSSGYDDWLNQLSGWAKVEQ